MSRFFVLAALLAAAGCDAVFHLDRDPSAPADARDARTEPSDTPTDCGPEEHDEDHDGIADRCDPCPYLAGVRADSDSDGDGIPDVCDPQTEQTTTRLAFFPFDAIPSDLRLAVEGANASWSATNDQLVIASDTPTGDYLAQLDVSVANVYIETQVTVTFTGTPATSRSAGVWAQIDPASQHPAFPAGEVFEVIDYAMEQYAHVVETSAFPVVEGKSAPAPELFQSGQTYRLALICREGDGCNGTVLSPVTAFVHDDPVTLRSGPVGLRAHGDVRAAFDYLVVYTMQ